MAVSGLNTGIIRMTAQGNQATGYRYVTYVRWVGGTTASHRCILKDLLGNIFFIGESDGANFTDLQAVNRWVEGIDVDTMQSGEVLIYTR